MNLRLKRLTLALTVILLATAILGYTPDTNPVAMRAKYANGASQFIDIGNGQTIHVRDEGPRGAPVVVLLHGSNSSLQTWDAWTVKLKTKFRVIRMDLPGHGLTGPQPQHDYSVKAFDAVVDAVTHTLGADHFTLVGNSMGGGIALGYAVRHPDRLSGLVLIDSAGAPEATPTALPIGFRIARTPVLNKVMNYITPRFVVEKSVHQSMAVQSIIDDKMVDRYWELLRYPGNRQATGERFQCGFETIDLATVKTIKTPTLVMWGEADTLIPFSAGQWFAKNIPSATLVSYHGVGHIPMEENAGQSADDLIKWISSQ